MDPRTGAVRALVGGRDFNDSKFNRATQALRQPGSTFKPIVYSTAIQNGRSPAYILSDEPLTVPVSGGSDWTPQNYDGRFEGKIPLRRSLFESRNVSTIRLGMELGEANVIEEARKFGITSPIPSYPSIFIGAADVYPIEMIGAYSAFATLGTYARPQGIVRVENQKGEVLWEPTPTLTQVMSAEEAWLMTSMLRDVVRRGTAAGAVTGAGFTVPAGGKTGTTNDGTDVWFVGFTPDLVAGVWIGTDKPSKIKANAQGGQLAAPAWTAFMREAYRRKPTPPEWPVPSGLVQRQIDAATGLLWGPYCRGTPTTEWFVLGTDPTRECDPVAITPAPGDTMGYPPPTTPYPTTPVPGTDPYARQPLPPVVQPGQPVPSQPLPSQPTRPAQPQPARPDTLTPSVFRIPPRDTTPKPAPRDTARPRPDTSAPPPPPPPGPDSIGAAGARQQGRALPAREGRP
jgi:penicillin-binding protein 1A